MIVDRYYYAQLNKQEQAVYKAFYNGLMAHEDVIPIPIKGQLTKEVFNKIFRAMTRDNPLIYYQSICLQLGDGCIWSYSNLSTVFLQQGNRPKVQS